MMKTVAASFLFLAATASSASECYPSLSAQDAQAAKSVIVFQVLSAEYRRGAESPLGDFVVARLHVVDQLRGKSATTHMSYYTGLECGPRINVGSFYAAFLPTLSRGFVGGAHNLVVVGQAYDQPEDRTGLQSLMRGQPRAEATLDESRAQLAHIPPPPPPCPRKPTRDGP